MVGRKSAKSGKKRKTKAKKRGSTHGVAKRTQPARMCSAALSHLLSGGASDHLVLTYGDAVKRLWDVAKQRQLQRGRVIVCDARMRRVFGCNELDMLDIPKAISAHLTSNGAASAPSSARAPAAAAPTPTADNGQLLRLSPALTALLCGDGQGHTARFSVRATAHISAAESKLSAFESYARVSVEEYAEKEQISRAYILCYV
eukprot:1504680-Pleurochrysis_carterae.AAC.1